MNIELLYTSAPQGLKQGSRGFCTVVSTVGLPINLAQKLESLSAYRHLYQPGDSRADSNPICHSHLRFQVGGRTVSVLSRVAAYGVDYSQRTNKIAHHIALADPLPRCGPAAVLLQPGFMRTEWDNQCRTLSAGPEVPSITLVPSVCQEWEKRTGDAGWAGVIANAWLQTSGKPVWIIFSEWQSSGLLAMMNEATAILPENRRWQATFSTYCTNLPPDIDCRVRCVIQGSDEARMAIARGLVIDLTKPMPNAVGSPAAQAARMGQTIGSVPVISASGSHDLMESSETELSASGEAEVTDSEREYQLEGLSSTPPAFLPPKRPKTNRSKSSQAPRTMQRKWKSAAMIGIAAVLLFGLTAGGLYLLWKSSQFSAVIATFPKEAEPLQQPPIVDAPIIAKAPEAPIAALQPEPDKSASPSVESVEKTTDPTPAIEIKFNQKVKSWPENQPVGEEEDKEVADISIEGKPDAKVTMKDGAAWFRFDDEKKKIFLKKSQRFDYEMTKTLVACFECYGKTKKFSIDITNVNEPTLTLKIVSPPDNREFFSENETIKVDVSGYMDESSQESPAIQWQKKIGDEWTDIEGEKKKELLVTNIECGSIRCIAKNDNHQVSSDPVEVGPFGKVIIDVNELIRITTDENPRMKIEIPLPPLVSVKNGMVRRHDFDGLSSPVFGDRIVRDKDFEKIQGAEPVQYKFPRSLFRSVNGQTLEQAELPISQLIHASKANSRAVTKFKNWIHFIDAEGQVIVELKAFFRELNLPEQINDLDTVEAFMNDIEKLRLLRLFFARSLVRSEDEIIKEIEALQRSLIESTVNTTEANSEIVLRRRELEFAKLKRHFATFETAFPNFLKLKLKNSPEVNSNPIREIHLLSTGLYNSQKRSPELNNVWDSLIVTTTELKKAIDIVEKLDLTIEGMNPVIVWSEDNQKEKVIKGRPEIQVKIDPKPFPTRFKLQVIPLNVSRALQSTLNPPGLNSARTQSNAEAVGKP